MKRILVLFLFFVNFLNAFGKEVIKYEGKQLNISKRILILEDETRNIKEEDIVKGLYDGKFKPNFDRVLNFKNNNST